METVPQEKVELKLSNQSASSPLQTLVQQSSTMLNSVAGNSTVRIELSFELEKLQKITKGFLWNKTIANSPYVVVSNQDQTHEFGSTEIASKSLNVKFCKPIYIDFTKGVDDPFVTVMVFDKLSKGDNYSVGKGVLLCEHMLDLGEIVENIEMGSFTKKELIFSEGDRETFSKSSVESNSQYYANHSVLKICGQKAKASSETLKLQFRGLGIKNLEKGFFNLTRTDPYFIITKEHVYEGSNSEIDDFDEHWQAVYKSKHIDNHINPVWEPFDISFEQLCSSDETKRLRIEIWDFEENGVDRIVGRLREPTTLRELFERKSIRGNADKSVALEIVEIDSDGYQTTIPAGLVVVLEAERFM